MSTLHRPATPPIRIYRLQQTHHGKTGPCFRLDVTAAVERPLPLVLGQTRANNLPQPDRFWSKGH